MIEKLGRYPVTGELGHGGGGAKSPEKLVRVARKNNTLLPNEFLNRECIAQQLTLMSKLAHNSRIQSEFEREIGVACTGRFLCGGPGD